MQAPVGNQTHSTGWVVQAWSSFAIAVIAMMIGILNLPVDNWIKGYMGIGLSFTVGSTFSVAKTTRDMHEAKRITSRIEEARVEKLLNEHHPLK